MSDLSFKYNRDVGFLTVLLETPQNSKAGYGTLD